MDARSNLGSAPGASSSEPAVLLVEDDPIMGASLRQRLQLEGFGVVWAHDLAAARQQLTGRLFPLVISDIRLPDGDGEALFATMKSRYGGCCPPAVFITGFGNVEQAVRLVRAGAWEYVQKPFDVDDLMQRVHDWLPQPLAEAEHWFGISHASCALETLVRQVATMDLPVLIEGASGVGKELIARKIHEFGSRCGAAQPFVAVNCAAVSEGLLESELFGHEAGAFTGASRRHLGMLEQAHGGVLFLDEIGDMPLAMQARLLRVLQDGELRRVGGEKSIRVRMRILCATHRSLQKCVEGGAFRADLYFRISGIPIHVPPLDDRPEDIVWLIRRRVETLNGALGQTKRIDANFFNFARVHQWDGNVRELFSMVDRAYHFSHGCWVRWQDANPGLRGYRGDDPSPAMALGDYLAFTERAFLEQSLADHDGRITQAAKSLGISRKTLWEKLKRHQISGYDSSQRSVR